MTPQVRLALLAAVVLLVALAGFGGDEIIWGT
jgi:hypothetical protein